MKALSLLLLLMLSSLLSAQTQTASQRILTPAQLQQDFDSLVSYIRQTHPAPFTIYQEASFMAEAAQLRQSLMQPMRALQFYRACAPLVAKLSDGHTTLDVMPNTLYTAESTFFPLLVTHKLHDSYIVVKHHIGEAPLVPVGAEILSINGIDAKAINDMIIATNSGENVGFRLERKNGYPLALLLKMYFDMDTDTFTVSYRHEGKRITSTLPAISLSQLKEGLAKTQHEAGSALPDYSLHLMADKNAALLDFRECRDRQRFRLFLDSALAVVHEKGIQNLIIDIRNNGGGDSGVGDELFQSIAKEPFTQFQKTTIKYSNPLKRQLQAICEADSNNCSTYNFIAQKPSGETESFETGRLQELRQDVQRFTGKVYLLTSIRTFSSASSFAQCFKHYKMGTIVGEETGGWIISFGDITSLNLPNSGLHLGVSHKQFHQVGAGDTDYHGTRPDVPVSEQDALEHTLLLIAQSTQHATQPGGK